MEISKVPLWRILCEHQALLQFWNYFRFIDRNGCFLIQIFPNLTQSEQSGITVIHNIVDVWFERELTVRTNAQVVLTSITFKLRVTKEKINIIQ